MDPREDGRTHGTIENADAEEVYGLLPSFVQDVREALDAEDDGRVRLLVEPLHYADQADLIEVLGREERRALLKALKENLNPEILPELDDYVLEDAIEIMGHGDLPSVLENLESDDVVYIVDQLDEEKQKLVVAGLPQDLQATVEAGLALPEYSAGRIMQRELVAVPNYWTVGETIDYLRTNVRLPEEFYYLFVVDPRHRPLGHVALSMLLRNQRNVRLRDIMEAEIDIISATADQEEVALLFKNKDLLSAPVVDISGRLVGRITVDDIIDVIDEEAEDDMLRLAGLAEVDLFRAVFDTVKARASWLMVNLVTAVLASLVIGLFEDTLQSIVALAVLMPIVASMGGNAGTQTLTVAVRSLATKELSPANAWRILGKEILVGLANGLTFAVLVGIVAYVWFGEPKIGFVIAVAMVINHLFAGLFGIAIPLTLDRLKIDPAIASSVFLTTVTDVVGFFAFLGLAALFLVG